MVDEDTDTPGTFVQPSWSAGDVNPLTRVPRVVLELWLCDIGNLLFIVRMPGHARHMQPLCPYIALADCRPALKQAC